MDRKNLVPEGSYSWYDYPSLAIDMKKFLLREQRVLTALLVAAIIAFAGLGITLPLQWSAPIRGNLRAHYDIARGRYRVFSYPEYSNRIFARLLRERYGIDNPVLTNESGSDIAYASAYNKVSMKRANRRFGHDVFKECDDDALKKWNALSWMEQLYPDAPMKATTVDCFRYFPGTAFLNNVVRVCGRPDEDPCLLTSCCASCPTWRMGDGSIVVYRAGSLTVTERSGKQTSPAQNPWKLITPAKVLDTPK